MLAIGQWQQFGVYLITFNCDDYLYKDCFQRWFIDASNAFESIQGIVGHETNGLVGLGFCFKSQRVGFSYQVRAKFRFDNFCK